MDELPPDVRARLDYISSARPGCHPVSTHDLFYVMKALGLPIPAVMQEAANFNGWGGR